MENLARLVKLSPLIILLLLSPLVGAYDDVLDEEYGNILTEGQDVVEDWDFDQIFYQKILTDNITLSLNQIRMYRPSNFSSQPAIGSKYIRIGIAEGNDTEPHLAPDDFYAASVANRWQMYADYLKFGYTSGYKEYDLDNGNNYVEPNTEYYIIWYTWGDWWTSGDSVKFPCGTKGRGTFDEWSIHRGNVTNTVWTDPWPGGDNLTFDINGWAMNASSTLYPYIIESTANTTFWIDTEINAGLSLGRNWTYGLWLGNDTTDFGSFEQNTTLATESTDMDKLTKKDGLMPGKFYHFRAWLHKNDTYPFVHGPEDYFLTRPDAPEYLLESNRTAYNTTLVWENGTCFEEGCKTVIFKSTTGYVTDPLSPGDATIVYNATGSEGNSTVIETGSEVAYYTAYSFIQREEDGENLSQWSYDYSTFGPSTPPLLDYTVNIYNEKFPFDLATVDENNWVSYEFATKDHVPILMGNATSNPFTVYCDAADLLTLRFINSSAYDWDGSVIERCYYIPTSNSTEDRNITAYKTNVDVGTSKGQAKETVFSYVDFTGFFTPQDYGIGIIKKSIENETVTIHSDYIQADKSIRTYLCQGDQYYFYAQSDELEQIRLGGIIIFEDDYTLDVKEESITNDTWRGFVDFTSGWAGESGETKTLWLKVTDSTQGLYNTRVKLYDSDGVLKDSATYTSNAYNFNYTYDTGVLNKTVHWANVYMQYHKGKLWWNDSTNYFWSTEDFGIEVDMATLDGLLNDSIGLSPLYIPATDEEEEVIVPYTVLIVTGIAIAFFFLFQPAHSAFALFFMGVILGILKLLGVISEAILPATVIAGIVVIGILLYAYYSRKKREVVNESE